MPVDPVDPIFLPSGLEPKELADLALTSIFSNYGDQDFLADENQQTALIAAENLQRTGPSAGFGQSQREYRFKLECQERVELKKAARRIALKGEYLAEEGEHIVHRDEETNSAHKSTNNQRYGFVLGPVNTNF